MAPPFSPHEFGKFILVEKIATGGMAEVFRAVMRGAAGFEKSVALKRILPLFSAEPDFVTLFKDEARIASTLTHANLVQTFDFGEIGGSFYLALELVEGVDLARLITAMREQHQPFPAATAAFIVAEAARGLGYAHEKRGGDGRSLGIIHRDVSPQNILVSYAGEVKVADFGIAKAAEKAHRTATGMVMGKLRYMAPEQVAGDDIDPRADVFALGVILYELITGGPLFPEQGARVAELIHAAPIVAPSVHTPGTHEELERIVLKALGRPREQRYARAGDLARDLSVWVNQAAPGFTREDLATLLVQICPPDRVRPPSAEIVAVAQKPAGVVREPMLATPVLRKLTPSTPAPMASKEPLGRTIAGHGGMAIPPAELAVSRPRGPRSVAVAMDPGADPSAATELRQLDVPTRTRAPGDGPGRNAGDVDAVPELLPSTRSTRTARTRRKLSTSAIVGIGLVIVILGSLGLVAFRFLWSNHSVGPIPDVATHAAHPALADAAPLHDVDAGALGPGPGAFTLVPRAAAAAQREARTRRFAEELRVARAGVVDPDYELLMSALDETIATLTLDAAGHAEAPPPLSPRFADAVAKQGLGDAYQALVSYVCDFGELPPLVRAALKGYFAQGRVVFRASTDTDPGVSMATLALWLDDDRRRSQRLAEVAQQDVALARRCVAPEPPRRHFAPLACEWPTLAGVLRGAGDATNAALLEPAPAPSPAPQPALAPTQPTPAP